MKQLPNARIRKIDLSDRRASGPVASQHRIRALPTLVVYDGTKLVTRDMARALKWLVVRVAEERKQ